MTLPSTNQIGVRLLEIAQEMENGVNRFPVDDFAPLLEEAIGLVVAGLVQEATALGLKDLSKDSQEKATANFDRIVRLFDWEQDKAAHTIRRCVEVYSW